MTTKQLTKLSHSRLWAWRRCRQRYYYQYVLREEAKPSLKMRLGSAGHVALANFYSGKADKHRCIEAAYEILNPITPTEEKGWETLNIVLNRYLDWTALHDKWEVLAVETEVLWTLGGNTYQGIVDLVVDDLESGKRMAVDHKFSESVRMAHLRLDPQANMYLTLLAGKKGNVDGLLFNYVVMADERKSEEPVERSYQERTIKFLQQTARELKVATNEIKLYHQGKLERYRNPLPSCAWDCPYQMRCLTEWEMGL